MSLIRKLLEEKSGIFIAWRLDKATEDRVSRFAVECGLPPPEEPHSTIIHTTSEMKGFEPLGKFPKDVVIPSSTLKLSMLGGANKGPHHNSVVLRLIGENALVKRHNEIVKDYNPVLTFPDYKPHITLNYVEQGSFDLSMLPKPNFDLHFVEEYSEGLK